MPNIQREPIYRARFEHRKTDTEKYPFIFAETGPLKEDDLKREHSRVIAVEGEHVAGHPIVCTDRYPNSRGADELYAYARHRVTQAEFFAALDRFLEQKKSDFAEIRHLPFHCVFSVEDEDTFFEGTQLQLPFVESLGTQLKKIDFFRLKKVAFGDISVDFCEQAVVCSDELRLMDEGALSKKMESPLFAFDASASDLWVPFLTDIHWASNLIPRDLLQNLIQHAMLVGVR
jgi:hypothetical protein